MDNVIEAQSVPAMSGTSDGGGGGNGKPRRRRAPQTAVARHKSAGVKQRLVRRRVATRSPKSHTCRTQPEAPKVSRRRRRAPLFHISSRFSKTEGLRINLQISTRLIVVVGPLLPGTALIMQVLDLYGF